MNNNLSKAGNPIARPIRRLKLVAPSLLVILAAMKLAAASPLALNLYQVDQFQGASIDTSGSLTGFGFIPPDMGGAVANGYVAQMVNDEFAIYTPSGALATPAVSLDAFYAGLGVNSYTQGGNPDISDPRIIYDPTSKRWYASAITVANAVNNTILLAVSKDSNPLDGFTGYSIASKKNQFADFPTLGVDHGAVTISSNNFNSKGSYTGSSVFSIPKAQLVKGVTNLSNVKEFNSTSKIGFTPEAVTSDGSGNKTTILSNNYGASGLLVSTVSNNAGKNAKLTLTKTINHFSGALTNAPTQPGGTTYDPGDNRISSGSYQAGNYIYFANSVLHGGSDQIQWGVLNASTDSLIKSGFVSLANEDLTYGSISGNAAGTFVIGFNGSGSTTNISDYGTVCSVMTGACNAPSLLYTGPASNYNVTFGGPSNRWGDYSWTAPDTSNPNNFWFFEEYPSTNGSWGTIITEVETTVPEPGSLVLLLTGVVGLIGLTRGRRNRATQLGA